MQSFGPRSSSVSSPSHVDTTYGVTLRRFGSMVGLLAVGMLLGAGTKAGAQAQPMVTQAPTLKPTITTLTMTTVATPTDAITTVPAGTTITLTATVTDPTGVYLRGPYIVNFCDASATDCANNHLLASVATGAGVARLRFVPPVGVHSYKAVSVSPPGGVAPSTSAVLPLTVTSTAQTILAITRATGTITSKMSVTANSTTYPTGSSQLIDESAGTLAVLANPTLAPDSASLSFLSSSSRNFTGTPAAAIIADFNGDGVNDAVVAGGTSTTGTITFFPGKGDGSFTNTTPTYTLAGGIQSMVTGDFNGDGYPDLAVAVTTESQTSLQLLLNNLSGGFTVSSYVTIASSTNTHVPLGTIDAGHGAISVVDIDSTTGTVQVVTAIGLGYFQTASPVSGKSNPGNVGAVALTVGDFNNDGHQDFAVVGPGGLTVYLFDPASNTFTPLPTQPIDAASTGVVASDFNGDGQTDLAISGSGTVPLTILLGNNDGTFTAAPSPVTNASTSLMVADFNGDGISDLVTQNATTYTATLLQGTGTGSFISTNISLSTANVTGFAVGDLNRDGIPDLLLYDAKTSQPTIGTYLAKATATSVATSLPAILYGRGTHSVTAQYTGDNVYSSSFAPFYSVLGKDVPTTLTLTSPATTSVFGDQVSVNVALTPYSVPTGPATALSTDGDTVTLNQIDGTAFGSGVLKNGQATIFLTNLPVGTTILNANYLGHDTVGAGQAFDSSISADLSFTVTTPAPVVVPALTAPVGQSVAGSAIITFTTGGTLGSLGYLTQGAPYRDFTPLGGIVVPTVPGIPTVTGVTAGPAAATISFAPPAFSGSALITGYTVTSIPGGITATGSASPITVTGLTGGQSYTFTVVATNTAGSSAASAASASVVPTIPATVPGAPAIPSATPGDGAATVSFVAPVNGGSAILSYTVTSSPGGVSVTGQSSPLQVTGLTNGQAYTFTVVAANAIGSGAASAESAPVTPVSPVTAPGAPSIASVTASSGQATVVITVPASNGGAAITSYTVTSSPGGITASGLSPVVVAGLTNGTAYTFTATATNSAGTSGASPASASVTPVGAPGAPSITTVTPGNGTVSVAFTAPASNGGSAITGYTVTSSGGQTATGTASPITVSGLTVGTAYTFTATATSSAGTSAASAASASVTPVGVPGAPTITTVTAGNGTASVAFTAPASNGGSAITGYTVTSSGGQTATGTASPILVTGLTNGLSYTLTMTATNASGTGAASSAVSALIPVAVPGAPTAVSVTPSYAGLMVSFTPPVSNGGAPITAYTATTTTGISVSSTNSPIFLTGLTNGTLYTVNVVAINAVGTSSVSVAATGTPSTSVTNVRLILTPTAGDGLISVGFSNKPAAASLVTAFVSPGGQTVSGTTSPLTITGLTNGQTYAVRAYYTVASGVSGTSFYSPVIPGILPGAPTNVTATAGDTTATVAFTAPNPIAGSSAITSYTVTSSPGALTATGTASPLTVSGLTDGTAYTFTVTASNSSGKGAASAASAPVTPLGLPSAPAYSSYSAGGTSLLIYFSPPDTTGGVPITSYTVTTSTGISVTGPASPVDLQGLAVGTAYSFAIAANTSLGRGAWSASTSATTATSNLPTAPTIYSVTPHNGSVTVNFLARYGTAVYGFITSQSVTGSNYVVANAAGATDLTMSGLTNGQSYTVALYTRNTFINPVGAISLPSFSAPFTPLASLAENSPAPAAPSAVQMASMPPSTMHPQTVWSGTQPTSALFGSLSPGELRQPHTSGPADDEAAFYESMAATADMFQASAQTPIPACVVGQTYAVGQTCSMAYTFAPTSPGQRNGAVQAVDANGNPLGTAFVTGTGIGPLGLFSSTQQTLSITGLNVPRGLSVDGFGNVYALDAGTGHIIKIAAGATTYSVVATIPGGSSGATIVDGAGNLYFTAGTSLYELIGGQGTIQTVASNLCGVDDNLEVDGAGNLYFSCEGNGSIQKVDAITHAVTAVYAGGQGHRFVAMAVDSAGNVFAPDFNHNILYELVAGSSTLTALVINDGHMSQPHGVALDPAGNVYVTNYSGSNSVMRYAAVTYAFTKLPTLGSRGIAIDGSGNLYTIPNDSSIAAYSRAAAPPVTFGPTQVGTTNASLYGVEFENDGNAPLVISAYSATAPFFLTGADNTCITGNLASGGSCFIGAVFSPIVAGPATGQAVMTIGSVGGLGIQQQTLALSGTATPGPQTITFPQPANLVIGGPTSIVLNATSTSGLPVTYSIVSGTATINGSTLTVTGTGAVLVEADQAGNVNFLAAPPVQRGITVTAPPVNVIPPPTAGGSTSGVQTGYLTFTTGGTLSSIRVLTQGVPSSEYLPVTDTDPGACQVGVTYAAGQACAYQYTFSPKGPGARPGAVVLTDASGIQLGSSYLAGIGNAPLGVVYSGTQTAVLGTSAGDGFGIAMDLAGNMYVGDTSGGKVRKFTLNAGTWQLASVVATVPNPATLAVDGVGNVWISSQHSIYKSALNVDGTYTTTPFFTDGSSSVTVDGSGSVFYANNTQVIKQALNTDGTYTRTVVATGFRQVLGMTVDQSGNLFVADTGAGNLFKLTRSGSTYTQTTIDTGLSNDNGVAVDAGGNLYVSASGSATGVLHYAPAAGNTYTRLPQIGTAIPRANGVAIDAHGNVFITNDDTSATDAIYEIDVNGPQTMPKFADTLEGQTSASQTVTLFNIGNADLTVASLTNPDGNFPIVGTPCAAGSALSAGTSCSLAISFVAPAPGDYTGQSIETDNSLNITGTQHIVNTSARSLSTAVLHLNPTDIHFADTPAQSSSSQWTLNFSNESGEDVRMVQPNNGIAIEGANPAEFTFTTECGAVVPKYSSCRIYITFTPDAAGSFTAQLVAHAYTTTKTYIATMSGTSTSNAPTVIVSPSNLTFADVPVGSKGNSQTVTISNTGATPLIIAKIASSDQTDFVIASSCSGTLAPYSTCNLLVSATPQAVGPITSVLTVTDNASPATQTVSLTGNGTSNTPTVIVSPSNLTFADVMVGSTGNSQTVTISNTGATPLVIAKIASSDQTNFLIASSCSGTLAPYSTCNLLVSATPQAVGPINAILTVTDNASPTTQTISLTGNGLSNTPTVLVSPTNLTFADVMVGSTGNSQTVTINNTGSTPLVISGIAPSDQVDFVVASSCIGTLAPHTTCNLLVSLKPQAVGPINGTITIKDNANPTTQIITLSGNGLSNVPTVIVAPLNLSFADVLVGSTGNSQTVTINNTGATPLVIANIVPSDLANFVVVKSCPATLAAYTTCTLTVALKPQATGPITGTLTVYDNASPATQVITLSGNGLSNTPTILVSPTNLTFADVTVGNTGNTQTATINNTGSTPLLVSSIELSDKVDFVLAGSCTGIIAPHTTCNVTVALKPQATGSIAGTLTVTDNANPSTQVITLSGTASAAPVPSLSIAVNPSALSLQVGSTGHAAFTMTPTNGYKGSVALTCGGLPTGVTCQFAPSTLTADGSNTVQTSQLTITTSGLIAGIPATTGRTSLAAVFSLSGLWMGLLMFRRRKSPLVRALRLMVPMLLLTALAALTGCGTGPTGSYLAVGDHTVTVTATGTASGNSGAVVQTANFKLTITQ